jgi:RimJ/RimL family protein N-acetyltransferase
MTRFDIIETNRLVLRRWREADREPFAELNGDPRTLVFFPSTLTPAESDAFVDRIEARFEAHGYGLWALEVRETGQFIGFTGLAPMQEDVPGAGGTEIGWRLARYAWHRGYATEAALAAREVAFTGAGLAELWSMTAVLNTPSQAVMRRIGMTEATRFDHPRVPDGSPLRPHVVYHLASPGAGELGLVTGATAPPPPGAMVMAPARTGKDRWPSAKSRLQTGPERAARVRVTARPPPRSRPRSATVPG